MLQVNCNQNSCTLTGAVNGGPNQCPIPIPYPFPFPGHHNHNGSHDGDLEPCINITTIQYINNQTSELLKLLDNTKIDDLIGLINALTEPLQHAVGKIIGSLKTLLEKILLTHDAIGGTIGHMDEMHNRMNVLEGLIASVLELLKTLLGLNNGAGAGLGTLTGLLGAGGGGGDATGAVSTAGAVAVAGGAVGAVGAGGAGGGTGAAAGAAAGVAAGAAPLPVGGLTGALGK